MALIKNYDQDKHLFRVSFYASKVGEYENKKFSFGVCNVEAAINILERFKSSGNTIRTAYFTLPVFDIQFKLLSQGKPQDYRPIIEQFYQSTDQLFKVIQSTKTRDPRVYIKTQNQKANQS